MDKPCTFLSRQGKQAKLLQALTRGLEDVAHVETRGRHPSIQDQPRWSVSSSLPVRSPLRRIRSSLRTT
jgi:hypothetical protein